jgi:hypothetical protein
VVWKSTGKKYEKMKCSIKSCSRKVGWIVKWYGKYRRKVSWLAKRHENYGRKVSWIVKRFGKYKRKVCWIVKLFGKYERKVGWSINPIYFSVLWACFICWEKLRTIYLFSSSIKLQNIRCVGFYWRTCDFPVWERVKHIVPVYNAQPSYKLKNLGKILHIIQP